MYGKFFAGAVAGFLSNPVIKKELNFSHQGAVIIALTVIYNGICSERPQRIGCGLLAAVGASEIYTAYYRNDHNSFMAL